MPMRVKMLYFGPARDASGRAEEVLSLEEGSSVRSLLDRVSEEHAKLRRMRGSVKVAVNEEIAKGDEVLEDGDVVALLPPVAGG